MEIKALQEHLDDLNSQEGGYRPLHKLGKQPYVGKSTFGDLSLGEQQELASTLGKIRLTEVQKKMTSKMQFAALCESAGTKSSNPLPPQKNQHAPGAWLANECPSYRWSRAFTSLPNAAQLELMRAGQKFQLAMRAMQINQSGGGQLALGNVANPLALMDGAAGGGAALGDMMGMMMGAGSGGEAGGMDEMMKKMMAGGAASGAENGLAGGSSSSGANNGMQLPLPPAGTGAEAESEEEAQASAAAGDDQEVEVSPKAAPAPKRKMARKN
ncbi:unnamed protein product [Amoebophrya sp. A25]|nr:unnamed protein product [Amoebophrya sp. A25]|eukprot:GSA25T00006685001.1